MGSVYWYGLVSFVRQICAVGLSSNTVIDTLTRVFLLIIIDIMFCILGCGLDVWPGLLAVLVRTLQECIRSYTTPLKGRISGNIGERWALVICDFFSGWYDSTVQGLVNALQSVLLFGYGWRFSDSSYASSNTSHASGNYAGIFGCREYYQVFAYGEGYLWKLVGSRYDVIITHSVSHKIIRIILIRLWEVRIWIIWT